MAACAINDGGSVAIDLPIVRAIGDLRLGIGAQVELLLPAVGFLTDGIDRPKRPNMPSGRWPSVEKVPSMELRLRVEVVLGKDFAIRPQSVGRDWVSGLAIKCPSGGDLSVSLVGSGDRRCG
jgi:hypothetical protein